MEIETTYKLLKIIEGTPEISQRTLAKEMNVSLGKVNYCLQALKEKGWLKAKSFKNSENKKAYAYVLTPKGINERAQITARFLKRKINEYEEIKQQIEQLKREIWQSDFFSFFGNEYAVNAWFYLEPTKAQPLSYPVCNG